MKNKKKIQNRKREYFKWTLILFILSFLLSATLNYISSYVSERLPVIISFILLFCIILLGIIFDIIGIATTAADEVPFHAMAAKKVKGAKVSVWLIKNASKVSSICNDVIGDICGILSGALSASIVFYMAKNSKANPILLSILLTAIVAGITISGKSIGKYFAIQKSNEIVKICGKVLGIFLKM
ncbi:hypothetical protein Calkro_1414 [Caldicellulosiruptor kronotskyensis 2002]|uniref:Mg2+ and Co2+ transporter CorB n=1 Tax=Caldicellulosiruptor kronotskyensis (strain DSM 18902 / VKM B-2412 / 2002) TaxID=632348 RepID=E4SC35_CALK2|nr:hypothetical protein [Caldicellulosiruptor kronotskyensis]ADQ46270.1 hypothetical protein Calkro_1414 [Caldicellulosiruptor kronotskyensis 2002]